MTKENKIQEMQLIEQSLQSLLYQKQVFQMEASETKSALKEVESSSDDVYKIVGQLMLKAKKDKVVKELKDKEKILDLRVKSLDKQEKTLTDQLEKLREEIMKEQKK